MPRFARHADTRPEEFAIYLNYVRKLTFDETPDYDFLRELFLTALRNNGDDDDQVYDWQLLNNGKGWETSSVSEPLHGPGLSDWDVDAALTHRKATAGSVADASRRDRPRPEKDYKDRMERMRNGPSGGPAASPL